RRLAAGFSLPGGLRQFLDAALISGNTSVIGADALLQFRLGGLDGLLFGFQGLVGVLQLRRGRRPWIGLLALLRAFLRRRRGVLSGVLAGLLVARFIAALLVSGRLIIRGIGLAGFVLLEFLPDFGFVLAMILKVRIDQRKIVSGDVGCGIARSGRLRRCCGLFRHVITPPCPSGPSGVPSSWPWRP